MPAWPLLMSPSSWTSSSHATAGAASAWMDPFLTSSQVGEVALCAARMNWDLPWWSAWQPTAVAIVSIPMSQLDLEQPLSDVTDTTPDRAGLNSELLRMPTGTGSSAVIFDYFEDPALTRRGRMDMLEVKRWVRWVTDGLQ